jgi:hypothetical protein
MNIRIYFTDGRVTSYSTDGLTTSDPFRAAAPQGSANILTEYNIRLDKLMEEGLFLDVNWYNLLQDRAKMEADELWSEPLSVAFYEPGRRIRLTSANAMMKMAKIVIDGEVVVWREECARTGDIVIVSGICFNMLDRIHSDAGGSIKERAFSLFNILQAIYPDKDRADICAMFGYTTNLLDDAITAVEAQQGVRKALTTGIGSPSDALSVPVMVAASDGASGDGGGNMNGFTWVKKFDLEKVGGDAPEGPPRPSSETLTGDTDGIAGVCEDPSLQPLPLQPLPNLESRCAEAQDVVANTNGQRRQGRPPRR